MWISPSRFRAVFPSAVLYSARHDLLRAHQPGSIRGEIDAAALAADPAGPAERIIVACAPKSGSTYVASVLQRYFSIPFGNRSLIGYDWTAEQNLIPFVQKEIAYRRFVLQMHLLPRQMNMLALEHLRPTTIFLWRNIADALVSYDDHIRNEDHRFPTFYVHDRENYLRLPEQERFQYLVHYAAPWYLAFYLGWRERGVRFRPYEAMVADPTAFIGDMIEEIRPGALDYDRLSEIIGRPMAETRFNAGMVGRSAERFSDETKRVLEALLLSHPERDRLRILLHELPWQVPILRTYDESDGRLLRDAGTGRIYFVDCGRKHYVGTPAWIQSRWPLRPVHDVPSHTLSAFPEATGLS